MTREQLEKIAAALHEAGFPAGGLEVRSCNIRGNDSAVVALARLGAKVERTTYEGSRERYTIMSAELEVDGVRFGAEVSVEPTAEDLAALREHGQDTPASPFRYTTRGGER